MKSEQLEENIGVTSHEVVKPEVVQEDPWAREGGDMSKADRYDKWKLDNMRETERKEAEAQAKVDQMEAERLRKEKENSLLSKIRRALGI